MTIDHSQPLILTNSLGKKLTAADTSSQVFIETTQPNVRQYNLKPLISQLQPETPWKIRLSTITSQPINLSVSANLVQEWQNLASY